MRPPRTRPQPATRAAASEQARQHLRGEDHRGDPEAKEERAKQVGLEQSHRGLFPYQYPCVASALLQAELPSSECPVGWRSYKTAGNAGNGAARLSGESGASR